MGNSGLFLCPPSRYKPGRVGSGRLEAKQGCFHGHGCAPDWAAGRRDHVGDFGDAMPKRRADLKPQRLRPAGRRDHLRPAEFPRPAAADLSTARPAAAAPGHCLASAARPAACRDRARRRPGSAAQVRPAPPRSTRRERQPEPAARPRRSPNRLEPGPVTHGTARRRRLRKDPPALGRHPCRHDHRRPEHADRSARPDGSRCGAGDIGASGKAAALILRPAPHQSSRAAHLPE